MKKIGLLFALCIFIIILLPVIGNKIANDEINKVKQNLKTYGLEAIESNSNSTYLTNDTTYKVSIKDTDKFISYINSISNANLPKNSTYLLSGLKFDTKIKYSNLPISDKLEIDISPISFPTLLMQDIQKNSPNFYEYLLNLSKEKRISYHLNYNLANEKFDGYLKDLNEEFVTNNNVKISFKTLGYKNQGEGKLFKPKKLTSNTDAIFWSLEDKKANFNFMLENISSSINYKSQSDYNYDIVFDKLKFNYKKMTQDFISSNITQLKINASANSSDAKENLHAITSLKSINIQNKQLLFEASDFKYDLSFLQLDKSTFSKIKTLISKANHSDKELQENIVTLLSKGLKIAINELSLKKLSINNSKQINGFKLKADMRLKQNPNLKTDIKKSSNALMKNIDSDANLKLSNEFFTLLNNELRLDSKIKNLAKKDKENLVYDMKFQDLKITINGKQL